MRLAVIIIAFTTLLLNVGCHSVHVTSNWNPNVDFSGLKTWSFAQSTADHPSAGSINQDDFFNSRVEYAIKQNLSAKGFTQVPAGRPASFHVRYHQVVNSEMSIAKLNSYAGYPDDMDMGMGTGAPRNSGFGLSEDPFVDHYMQDTLFIDIANASGSELIWRGSGATNRGGGRPSGSEQDQIDKRVDKILADFPPS